MGGGGGGGNLGAETPEVRQKLTTVASACVLPRDWPNCPVWASISSPQSGAKNTHLKGLLLELSALEMIPFLFFYVSAFFWKPPRNPLEVVEYQS